MCDLSLEIVALGVSADSAVANDNGIGGFSNIRVDVIAPLTRCRSDDLDSVLVCILPQSVGVKSQFFRRFAARYVPHGTNGIIRLGLVANQCLVITPVRSAVLVELLRRRAGQGSGVECPL